MDTDKTVALIQIKLEFGSAHFCGESKNRRTLRKTLNLNYAGNSLISDFDFRLNNKSVIITITITIIITVTVTVTNTITVTVTITIAINSSGTGDLHFESHAITGICLDVARRGGWVG